jgi:hypothetical protein
MKTYRLPTLIAAFTAIFAGCGCAEFHFSEKDGALQLLDGEKLITAFRTDYRVPYLYPLTAPSGANVLRHWPMEEDAPTEEKDHPHHRGLWLSHGNVNGYDFWAGFDKKNASITLNSVTEKKAEGGKADFTAELTWTAQGNDLLSETRSHKVSNPDPGTLRIDIHSTLTALAEKVTFGDTKEGTFAIRMDRTLRVTGKDAKATLTNSSGETNLAAWGKRANWAAYSGPDEKGENVVVAIVDNPSSFRNPTHWHARDYGLLAANPFGIHDFEKTKNKTAGALALKKGETLVLKYTVIIHQGTLESAALDRVYQSLPRADLAD